MSSQEVFSLFLFPLWDCGELVLHLSYKFSRIHQWHHLALGLFFFFFMVWKDTSNWLNYFNRCGLFNLSISPCTNFYNLCISRNRHILSVIKFVGIKLSLVYLGYVFIAMKALISDIGNFSLLSFLLILIGVWWILLIPSFLMNLIETSFWFPWFSLLFSCFIYFCSNIYYFFFSVSFRFKIFSLL